MPTESRYVPPRGLCECGCGGRTPLARTTDRRNGYVKGEPIRFIHGHNATARRRRFVQWFEEGQPDACWLWQGGHADGYGRYGRNSELAHRVAYRLAYGRLDPEHEVTHTCGNRACVNPSHLALREFPKPNPPNPSGLCQCGCGAPAPIARQTDNRLGWVAGEPLRFIVGHVGRLKRKIGLTPDQWDVLDCGHTTPCFIWRGKLIANGYARVNFGGRTQSAHRVAYELAYGPIPQGFDVDHLCAQRACVNPDHLEAVTRSVNVKRAWERRKAAAT